MTTEREDLEVLDEPSIDFLILADRAEAVNGKLYMMGGGWTRTEVPDIKQPALLSFALGILVPWNATNQKHTVRMTIENLDRQRPVQFELGAEFVAGRPAQAAVGETQRVMMAGGVVPVIFPAPGTYQLVARVNNGTPRRVEFHVVVASQRPTGAQT